MILLPSGVINDDKSADFRSHIHVINSWNTRISQRSDAKDIPVLGIPSCRHSMTSLLSASVFISIQLTSVYTAIG